LGAQKFPYPQIKAIDTPPPKAVMMAMGCAGTLPKAKVASRMKETMELRRANATGGLRVS